MRRGEKRGGQGKGGKVGKRDRERKTERLEGGRERRMEGRGMEERRNGRKIDKTRSPPKLLHIEKLTNNIYAPYLLKSWKMKHDPVGERYNVIAFY